MFRVGIVDDEPLARQGLRAMLGGLPDIVVCGEADSVEEARAMLRDTRVDGLFLDVRMPGRDGFALLRGPGPVPPVVFVTAHAGHAVQAFEVDAVDYLLKPARKARLATAVERMRRAAAGIGGGGDPAYLPGDAICLRMPGRTVVAALGDLILLEADGDFTRVQVAGQPPLLICRKLGQYERELPAPPFVRLDRSIIVNLSAIERIDYSPRNTASLHLRGIGKPLEIGRAARERLRPHLVRSERVV